LIAELLILGLVTVEQVNRIKGDIQDYISKKYRKNFKYDEIYAGLNLEDMGGFGMDYYETTAGRDREGMNVPMTNMI
jgi:hypothetical protein